MKGVCGFLNLSRCTSWCLSMLLTTTDITQGNRTQYLKFNEISTANISYGIWFLISSYWELIILITCSTTTEKKIKSVRYSHLRMKDSRFSFTKKKKKKKRKKITSKSQLSCTKHKINHNYHWTQRIFQRFLKMVINLKKEKF